MKSNKFSFYTNLDSSFFPKNFPIDYALHSAFVLNNLELVDTLIVAPSRVLRLAYNHKHLFLPNAGEYGLLRN